MKKLLFCLLVLVSVTSYAQIDFTDPSLEMILLEPQTVETTIVFGINGQPLVIDGSDGSIPDNQISIGEALNVGSLNLQNTSIITTEDLRFFTNLIDLNCSNTDSLTYIDVSYLTSLNTLNVQNCSFLTTINCKNGVTNTLDFLGCDFLVYVCGDDADTIAVDEDAIGLPNYVVNSFCSTPPGDNYNKISGEYQFTSSTIIPKQYMKVVCVLNEGLATEKTLQTITDSDGEYEFYTQDSGEYIVKPGIDYGDAVGFSIDNSLGTLPAVGFINQTANLTTNAALVATTRDVSVLVSPVKTTVPNQIVFAITCKNKGTQIEGGTIDFQHPNNLNYFSTTGTLVNSGNTSTSFSFFALAPFETQTFTVTFDIGNGNPQNSVTATIYISANTTTFLPDILAADNTSSYKYDTGSPSPLVGNKMTCLNGDLLPGSDIGTYLNYAITFENNSTQLVKNVVIKTAFDAAKYDMSSLQVINASHPLDLNSEGSNVSGIMRNGNLGGPGGSGGVALKIRTLPTIPLGTTVSCEAIVLFEYEDTLVPLTGVSDPAPTTFQNLSTAVNTIDNTVSIYPNPAVNEVTVQADFALQSIQLYDVFGRLLQTNLTQATVNKMDISARASGIYFIKVTSDKGQKVQQVVKE